MDARSCECTTYFFDVLYSRLAQHYGEFDPRSYMIAQRVATQIDLSLEERVLQTLRDKPLDYWMNVSASGSAQSIKRDAYYMRRQILSRVYSRFSQLPLNNQQALAQSAPAMIADYKRLRNGSWAAEKTENLEASAREDVSNIQKKSEDNRLKS